MTPPTARLNRQNIDSEPVSSPRVRAGRRPLPRAPHEIDIIIHRAELLDPPDAALLLTVFREGLPVAHVAALRNTRAKNLRYRLRALVARLLSPEFAFILAHQRRWSPLRRAIADAVFIRGLTFRDAARAAGVSIHIVRKHADAIRALIAANPPPTTPPINHLPNAALAGAPTPQVHAPRRRVSRAA